MSAGWRRRSLVGGLARGLAQLERASRVTQALERFVEGVALAALSDDELAGLTDNCYADRRPDGRQGLFDWEERWFDSELPAPPARILLGGAGSGRELMQLRAGAYSVVAFDPMASGADTDILRARYQDLLEPRASEAARRIVAGAPYDALVLGWGSFTHVPGADTRLGVLRALRALSDGPLLLSYWARQDGAVRQSRAHELGRRVGATLRRHGPQADTTAAERVVAHCGYAHAFSRSELEQLARQAGYRARFHEGAYPHATLLPAHTKQQ